MCSIVCWQRTLRGSRLSRRTRSPTRSLRSTWSVCFVRSIQSYREPTNTFWSHPGRPRCHGQRPRLGLFRTLQQPGLPRKMRRGNHPRRQRPLGRTNLRRALGAENGRSCVQGSHEVAHGYWRSAATKGVPADGAWRIPDRGRDGCLGFD